MGDSFGDNLAKGMAIGASMFDSAQRRKDGEAENARREQEFKWKEEDRSRAGTEREQMASATMARSAFEQGNPGPMLKAMNDRGVFGEGVRLQSVFEKDGVGCGNFEDNDGNLTAKSFGKPLNQMANAGFISLLPPAAAASILAKVADPETAARLQSLNLDTQVKAQKAKDYAGDHALEVQQKQAAIASSQAHTAAAQAQELRAGALAPYQLKTAESNAALAEKNATKPDQSGLVTVRQFTDDGEVTMKMAPEEARAKGYLPASGQGVPGAMPTSGQGVPGAMPPPGQGATDPKSLYKALIKSGMSQAEARQKVLETISPKR